MKRVLLLRIGHGTDSRAEALDAMAWHRDHGCWLSNLPLEADEGTFVIGACCGGGRGLLVPGVLGYGSTAGEHGYEHSFPVAWSSLTLEVDPDHPEAYWTLAIRTRNWLLAREYAGLMHNATISDLTVDQSASAAA